MKVYILSTYEEHGSYDVKATLDPEKLPAMLAEYEMDDISKELENLAWIKEEGFTITDRNGQSLSEGWGGILLHVVELS